MPETNRSNTIADSLLHDPEGAWDRSATLEILGGDETLLNAMIEIFLLDSPKLLGRLEQALLHRDHRELELAAHSLKGELMYLGVQEATETAEKLEAAGRTGRLEGAEELLQKLRSRLAVLWTAVSHVAGS
jgi:HPt (histidine-containing phosphotransfer) domain-containing protein